jgi:hypothetical protein
MIIFTVPGVGFVLRLGDFQAVHDAASMTYNNDECSNSSMYKNGNCHGAS